ncbi:type IV toxin-antitoxin system AbiEi family antitoxin [Nocardia sp. NPDC127579]|uniref:type IV toxin-antitoxin system AbiEi family antitoxin n=1 Tax=Nocardia sp. NPDC127579 TaxID=3345402 RepID=UPI00363660DB
MDARGRAHAAAHWSRDRGVLVGYSAAALHGAKWLDRKPAEIAVPGHVRAPRGVRVFRDVIPEDQVSEIDGVRCTTPARTAYDLGRRLDFDEAVETIDALCHATRLVPDAVAELVASLARARGGTRVRNLLRYVDGGAESIPESRTRLLLQQAGLPKPHTQIRVIGPDGFVVARLDMGWPEWRVAVEYDGAHHWTDPAQRTWDIDRNQYLNDLGWTIIHVSAALLRTRPHHILSRVTHALRARGAPL